MKYKKGILIIYGLFSFFIGSGQQFFIIPTQTIQPYKILGFHNDDEYYNNSSQRYEFRMAIDSFEINRQVSFAQYKEYLEAIKKDSSYSFYISQFPDSGITSKENYAKYISKKKYDNYPVLGISWEAAMNYCKWKTLKENRSGKIKYIYRLPKLSEWLDASSYLDKNKISNDFNKNYSDWTMNTYYESISGLRDDSVFTYDKLIDLPVQKDHPRYKRKIAMGDSYLFQRERLQQHISMYYTFKGYRQIAFRLVKVPINENNDPRSLTNYIMAYWGLK